MKVRPHKITSDKGEWKTSEKKVGPFAGCRVSRELLSAEGVPARSSGMITSGPFLRGPHTFSSTPFPANTPVGGAALSRQAADTWHGLDVASKFPWKEGGGQGLGALPRAAPERVGPRRPHGKGKRSNPYCPRNRGKPRLSTVDTDRPPSTAMDMGARVQDGAQPHGPRALHGLHGVRPPLAFLECAFTPLHPPNRGPVLPMLARCDGGARRGHRATRAAPGSARRAAGGGRRRAWRGPARGGAALRERRTAASRPSRCPRS